MAHTHDLNCLERVGKSLICKVTGSPIHTSPELPSKKGTSHTVKVVRARFSSDAGKYDGIIVAEGIGIVSEMNGMDSPKAAFDSIMRVAREIYPEEFGGKVAPTPRGLSREQAQALIAYARKNGRTWKSQLNLAWSNGRDAEEVDGHLLRQIRNNLGPSWLIKVGMSQIERVAGMKFTPQGRRKRAS